jgi:spore coat polysaccharide biosynthesis protein SpsF
MIYNDYLVRAEYKDLDLLYQWANDETVRNNSFHSNKIAYVEHKEWFYNKLNSEDTDIFIYYINQTAVGQIRLDYYGENAIIGYSIDKVERGKGYGQRLLQLIEQNKLNLKKEVICFIGKVKYANIASQKVFRQMGYSEYRNKDYIEYIKKVI